MSTLRRQPILVLVALLTVSTAGLSKTSKPPPTAAAQEAVAIVLWTRGAAGVLAPDAGAGDPRGDGPWRPLRLLELLAAGCTVRTAADSEIRLTFFDGRRFLVEADSRAVVEATAVTAVSGSVGELEPLPALVLAPIDPSENAGRHPAADRIRHDGVVAGASFWLYPRHHAAVLAHDANLRFAPLEDGGEYRVDVLDAVARSTLFSVTARAPEVRVPPAVLAPGTLYYWQVSGRERILGGGFFRTLEEAQARSRLRLADQASRSRDPDLRFLLARVDHELGLSWEACSGLSAFAGGGVLPTGLAEWMRSFGCEDFEIAEGRFRIGFQALRQGRLDVSREHLEHALALQDHLAPDSLSSAATLTALGSLSSVRGELDIAVDYLERALKIREQRIPESLELAQVLNFLGKAEWRRGDLEQAEKHHRRAVAIREARTPGSALVAQSLTELGNVAIERGDLRRAERLFQRGLDIREALDPQSASVAFSLNNLGRVAFERGDLDAAERHMQSAMTLFQKIAARAPDPRTLPIAFGFNNLGEIALARGDFDLAEQYFRQSLEIQERRVPESISLATSLENLGQAMKGRGDPVSATAFLYRAVDILEAQIGNIGGSSGRRGGYRARYGHFYRDLVELLLERDLPGEALAVLERSRARTFLAMLAERDLLFSSEIPEELERTRRSLAERQDRIQRRLARSSAAEPAKIGEIYESLRQIRRERGELEEAVRSISPALGELRDPQPLELRQVREILEPGTLMLSYSVGEQRSDLFAVTREKGLEVYPLAIGERELRGKIFRFRELIPSAARGVRPETDALFENASRELYGLLAEPAAEEIGRSERVLIVPDGPLHLLPFAALMGATAKRVEAGASEKEYLIEWKPLHTVLSATVYAQLQRLRSRDQRSRPDAEILLTAFGDPRYPGDPNGVEPIRDVQLRGAVDRGLDFSALPSSRREIEGIAALYLPGETRIYLGDRATEERAKAVGREVGVLHFATHGFVDERFPLNSGLVLSLPEDLSEGRDNGLLQAWEIFERVRLDADLVVLSACASGLGKELGAEGLIGLTRAFQYAGARTVASTLWPVDDRVTAELMLRFHRHLREGRPKDEALRAAQLALIREPIQVRDEDGRVVEIDASAPYYWAAFQIVGDWR